MKQLITLFILLISLVASAQTEHMKFMGIPINGNITAFQSKLVQKGFKFVKNEASSGDAEVYKQYSGKFAGKECKLYVAYNRETKIVYEVQVVYKLKYPSMESNFELEDMYKSLKTQLTKKYNTQAVVNGNLWDDDVIFNITSGSIRLLKTGSSGTGNINENAWGDYTEDVLHIIYTDNINYNKSKSSFVSDDL